MSETEKISNKWSVKNGKEGEPFYKLIGYDIDKNGLPYNIAREGKDGKAAQIATYDPDEEKTLQ